MDESLIYVNIWDLCYRSIYSPLGLETSTENQFLEVYYNKTWLIQHFYCSTVIGAVTSCANYLSKFVTTTMQLSLRYWKVYTFHVYACILKDSKWQKKSKHFFTTWTIADLQVPFLEQEPFYLSEFQQQSSHLLDAAQSNSLKNGKHDVRLFIT